MKSIVLILLVIPFCNVHAQSSKLNFLSNLQPEMIDSVPYIESDTLLFVKFDFAKANLFNLDKINVLKRSTILAIDLVYATYVESSTFDQYSLNASRFNNLLTVAPFLFEQDNIEWRILGSTAWSNEAEAKKLFSGFVFHLRPINSKEQTEKEIEIIKRGLHPELYSADAKDLLYAPNLKKRTKLGPVTKSTNLKRLNCHYFDSVNGLYVTASHYNAMHHKVRKKPKFKGGEMGFYKYISKNTSFKASKKLFKNKKSSGIYSFNVDTYGNISNIHARGGNSHPYLDSCMLNTLKNMPKWSQGITNGLILNYSFIVNFSYKKVKTNYLHDAQHVEAFYLTLCDIIDTSKGKAATPTFSYTAETSSVGPDTTVFSVFNRNKNWQNILVVADLTGSMAPYTGQLLVWFKLKLQANEFPIKHLTFFNDGNLKMDMSKVVGSTGGIYHSKVEDKNFLKVEKLAFETMRNGGGGDCPENNLEAVIEGINACKDCEQVVMIADNYATPRDLELINQIERPVKVILCGTDAGINTQYMDFVRKNKGSLHIMEQDIVDLMNINEGKTVEINGVEYQIRKDKFYRIF